MSLAINFILAHALCFTSPQVQNLNVTENSVSVRDSVADYAKTFIGTPYKYAQASPKGFDCSGFTWFVYNHFHVEVPRSSKDYANFGKRVPIDSARTGDIILFTGTNPREKRVGHVGIVISDKGEPLRFIHSSSSDNHFGVVITEYHNSNYPKRFIGITSVLP